jgi:hypothetical protein
MTELSRVTASYAITASGWAWGELDLKGLSPDEMADLIEEALDPDVWLCHKCAHRVNGPEVDEMTGFSVGGIDYVRSTVDGHWRRYDPQEPVVTSSHGDEATGPVPDTFNPETGWAQFGDVEFKIHPERVQDPAGHWRGVDQAELYAQRMLAAVRLARKLDETGQRP